MTISKTIANLLPLSPPPKKKKKKNLPVSESRDLPAAVHHTKQCIVIQCVTIELVKRQTRRTQKEKLERVIFLVNLQGPLVYVPIHLYLLSFFSIRPVTDRGISCLCSACINIPRLWRNTERHGEIVTGSRVGLLHLVTRNKRKESGVVEINK